MSQRVRVAGWIPVTKVTGTCLGIASKSRNFFRLTTGKPKYDRQCSPCSLWRFVSLTFDVREVSLNSANDSLTNVEK